MVGFFVLSFFLLTSEYIFSQCLKKKISILESVAAECAVRSQLFTCF